MKRLLTVTYLLVLVLMIIFKPKAHAQYDISHLTQLVDASEEIFLVQPSPDGRWAAYYTWFENRPTTISIIETKYPFKKIVQEGVTKHYFISNQKIAVQKGNELCIKDLVSGTDQKIEHVSKIEFFEKKNLLLVHYDATKQNMLEIYDRDLTLKQTIGYAVRWVNANDGLVVWSKESNYKLFKIVNAGGGKVMLWTSEDEILTISESGSGIGGLVINSKTSSGLRIHFLKEGQAAVEMTGHDVQGYSFAAVNASSDHKAIHLKFIKTIPKKDQLVDIWYGKEQDLHTYIRDEHLAKSMLWYPEANRVHVFSDDFTGYTALGNNGLFLMMKKNKDQVDVKDEDHLPNKKEIYLWNSKTHKEFLLPLDDGHMNIDPEGNALLIKGYQKWMIFDTEKLRSTELDWPLQSVPYFTIENKIIWVVKNELWEQDIRSLRKNKLFALDTDQIEIYRPKKIFSGIGDYRLSEYLDKANELTLIAKNTETLTSSYVHWKNNKVEVVIPETSDRIQYFGGTNDQQYFFWIEDNYNKPFSIMAGQKSLSAIRLYVSNAADEKVKSIKKIKLSYKGAEGEQLAASLYLPANFDANKKYPVVLSIYEQQQRFMNKFLLPTFKNSRGINARLLLESGYLVMFPDITHGDQGPAISAMVCVDNVLDELKKLPYADMKKIGMMGQSGGGYEINFIASQSDRFAAFISGSSISDMIHTSYALNYNFGSPDYYRFEYGLFGMNGSFVNNKQKYIDNNPLYHASKVNTPMLLWAGTNDKNVDPEETRSMFNVLRKYRKPVVGLFYRNEGHALGGKDAQKDLSLRVLDWYDYHLSNHRNIPWIDKQMAGAVTSK